MPHMSQLQLSVLKGDEELAHNAAVGNGSGHPVDGRITPLGQIRLVHHLSDTLLQVLRDTAMAFASIVTFDSCDRHNHT